MIDLTSITIGCFVGTVLGRAAVDLFDWLVLQPRRLKAMREAQTMRGGFRLSGNLKPYTLPDPKPEYDSARGG